MDVGHEFKLYLLTQSKQLTIRISGVRISARLRMAYMKAIFQQSVTTIDGMSPGAVANRLTTNSNIIESGISQQYFLAVQAISFTIGLFVVAFIKDAILTLVSTVAIPIVLIAYMIAVPYLNKYWYQAEAEKDRASALAYEMFQSVRIVFAFGAENRLSSQHSKILEKARKIDRKQAPVLGTLFAPMFIAIYGIFALTFWYGVRQTNRGKIHSIGTIIGECSITFQ
jgi:ATP-binding cassette, subfamily B (MDR/TAP), member 1